jgi:uncharacterized repeat protein (TIGR01451 family)
MRARRLVVSLFVLVLIATALPASLAVAAEPGTAASSPGVEGPVIGPKVVAKKSKAVRDLPQGSVPISKGNPLLSSSTVDRDTGAGGAVDPVAQFSSDDRALDQLGNPIVNVTGQGGANPNDTNGDVGPNDYVQMINSQFRIYDKAGAPRGPAAAISTLWTSANPADTSECATQNAGDPVVLYDNLADRWLLSQFARSVAPAPAGGGFICVAISQTADPTGAYYLYQFQTQRFPDYYKVGAWPDGYYVSANLNGPNTAMANVYDRANMLNGNPAGSVQFEVASFAGNFDTLIPSDVDGFSNPPLGTPNFLYRPHDTAVASVPGPFDNVEMWEFQTDWVTPANSSITGPTYVQTAPFDSTTCGYVFPTDCIPQPGTAQLITAIPLAGMFRFPYRNYGDREVLAGNFTVDANGADGVGIRWFILERTGGGAWSVATEGTYAPQPTGAPAFVHRWMGSVAMDRFGNLALGHSRSSSAHPTGTTGFPSAYYTGRLASDPNGLLPQPEILVRQGQSATGSDRWGDYYAMTVDPVDDCTFWYTGDSTGAGGFRQSSIASFRFSDCATDLEISKTVDPTDPNAGEEIVYTITVANNGPIGAQNVVVSDVLPAAFNYLANTDACSGVAVGATGTLTCQLGTIGAGQSRSFQIKGTIDAALGGATAITNTATVSSAANESDPADNVATLTHLVNELADVRVTKFCKPDTYPAPAGTSGVCSIFVTNDGPSAARLVNLVDTHVSNGAFSLGTPSNGACVVVGGVMTCPLGQILPGTTVRVDVPVSSNDRVDVNDTAVATSGTPPSGTPDPNDGNNQATAGLSFDASANLSITKTGPASAVAGTQFDYTLTVDNAGPSSAEAVVVSDELPAGVDFVSASATVGTFTAVAGTVTWNLGTVAPADPPRTLTITVKVHPDTTAPLVNNASVTSLTSDPNTANNLATWTVAVNAVAGLTLTKTDSPDPVVAGADLTYTLTVGNGGPSTAVDVVVTDTLPAGTTLVSAVGGTGSTACAEVAPGSVSCEVGDLDPGESETLFITVHIASSVPDGTVLVNNAVAESPTDPDGANASAATTVIARADLWMEKTGTAPAGNPAGALIYTLTVHNHPGSAPDDTPTSGTGGPSDALNVVVSDPLPLTNKKMTVQFLTPGCTYDKPLHKVTCTAAVVPYGTSVVFSFQVQVQGSVGTITNTATVTASTTDPVAANNSDTTNNVVQGGTGKGKKP